MRPYKSTILAKFITAYLNDKRADVNMTKIQKHTYIVYGSFLAIHDERICDERPKAWPYGPVFPTTRNNLLRLDLNAISLSDNDVQEIASDRDVVSLMGIVYNTFGQWPASYLSEWSHKEGSPWERTVYSDGFKWGDVIGDDFIKSYFKKIIVPKNGN